MPEEDEREKLATVIRQWNNNRLDLFEISQPDASLVFHGVMRFYLEDHNGGNVATKCVRFSSISSARDVIETLAEKFRPDMKMLSTCYSLYEIHADQERKLDQDERPLVTQLNWNSDNREGRFVLKKDKRLEEESGRGKEKGGVIQNFRRTLSRKDKKARSKAKDLDHENGSGEDDDSAWSAGSTKQQHTPAHTRGHRGILQPDDRGLPLGIKFSDNAEDAFLSAVINYTNSSTVHFKLSPAYILYAAGRFALRRRASPPAGSPHSVTSITGKMAVMTGKVIQRQRAGAGALAFWMANSSELLNFLKQDKELSRFTQKIQLDLSRLVLEAYSCLTRCLQNELEKHLPTFLIDPEEHGPLPAGIEMVLNALMNAMSLLRRCQVNPALTIQLFSQLFHFVSAWLFNRLMSPEAAARRLRSHYWGAALRQRLSTLEAWAERQGLELAADCHLGLLIQATTLLTMNKYSPQDAKDIQNTCFKLNSLQLQTLLAGYLYANNEPHIPADLIDAVVTAAEASADAVIGREGRVVEREESLDLRLPFLLPDGGYSCDRVRGIPQGLREFLEPMCQKGLCALTSQTNPDGDWRLFFNDQTRTHTTAAQREPEIVTITLKKPLNSGMGVSIVAAKGAGQDNLGIYIKSVVQGGPAELNGGLAAGDLLLSVDGQGLLGLSQERAVDIMLQIGPIVTLQVAKLGAIYHGLGALLCDPTLDKTEDGRRGKDTLPHPEGRGRRLREQTMQRDRQFYRSNPNVTNFSLGDRDERVDPGMSGNSCVSTVNLCTDTIPREYLTLPNTKHPDKKKAESGQNQQMFTMSSRPSERQTSGNKRWFLRQALSQENLCVDAGGPLLDNMQKTPRDLKPKQNTSLYPDFPVRPSVSHHDVLSDTSPPARRQQRGSGAGVWRTPFQQQPTPTPSIQPIRIDIPVTAGADSHPALGTFGRNGLKAQAGPQTHHVGSISPSKRVPQPSFPTKHVSFQEPDVEPHRGPEELAGPWRRDAQEKLEKQQRLKVVGLLGQEVQDLRAKDKRTAEENERLRKLSLEWQFQRRLREVQRRAESEDGDEDEDLDVMLVIQQLEKRNKRSSDGKITGELKKETGHFSTQEEIKPKADERPTQDKVAFKENQQDKARRAAAPEKLPFKERQRLFSFASSG